MSIFLMLNNKNTSLYSIFYYIVIMYRTKESILLNVMCLKNVLRTESNYTERLKIYFIFKYHSLLLI